MASTGQWSYEDRPVYRFHLWDELCWGKFSGLGFLVSLSLSKLRRKLFNAYKSRRKKRTPVLRLRPEYRKYKEYAGVCGNRNPPVSADHWATVPQVHWYRVLSGTPWGLLMRKLYQVITSVQAHILSITSAHSVDKNSKSHPHPQALEKNSRSSYSPKLSYVQNKEILQLFYHVW
jgi:hypothetical protein